MISWKYLVYIIGIVIAAFAGTPLLYFIKKFIVDEKTHYEVDWDGIIERAAVTALIISQNYLVLLIPIIVGIRVFYYVTVSPQFKRSPDILGRPEFSLAYQRVKSKSILGIDLIGSPCFAILIGLLLVGFFS